VSPQSEEQETWLAQNPKQLKAMKKLLEKINAVEDREAKVDVVRGLTYVLLMFTELSYIERLGILCCVDGQIKDNMRSMMVLQAMQKSDERPQSAQASGRYIA